MSEQSPDMRRVLVLHRQELRDVCALLDEHGVAYEERSSALPPGADPDGWRLVVATPQRVLELQASGGAEAATLIAVCDGYSKTLAARLSQARVDFVLRRPVHPGALRLLLMHALYHGPEKRLHRRVSIGASVRVRLGWRARPAMLLELSTTGCRLQIDRAAAHGSRVRVVLPAELTGGGALRLRGRVVRAGDAAGAAIGCDQEVAVQFDPPARRAAGTLATLVRAYDRGPAAWKDAPRPATAARQEAGEGRDAAGAVEVPRRGSARDRRRSPRLRYAKPVLVKGEGASRVLMGRDLSTGGMRVTRDPKLRVGDVLKLALYGEEGIPPLMLQATVAREDGPFLMLRFGDPGDSGLDQLHRLITSLPLQGPDEAGRATDLVVSEIVEHG